ncbi:MAG: CRTAC1 family protein [Pirellulales bacterium]
MSVGKRVRRRGNLRSLAILTGVAACVSLVVYLLWPADDEASSPSRPEKASSATSGAVIIAGSNGQTSPASPSSVSPPIDSKLAYKPRHSVDSSGFLPLGSSIPKWSADATLDEVSRAWRGYVIGNTRPVTLARTVGPLDDRAVEAAVMQTLLRDYEGRPDEAYEILTQLRTKLADSPKAAAEWLYTVIFLQGVTSLRLGEDENCILCRGEASCILPLSAAAVHTNRRGSTRAIGHFAEYLERFPDDLGARWLLNLANMTLGQYPDGVEARFRLPMTPPENPEHSIGAFGNVGDRLGINRYNQAGGGIMDDFDNDGWFDLVTTSFDPSQPMAMYLNRQNGRFKDVSASVHVGEQLGGLFCVQSDFNHDGFLDVFITRGAWLLAPIRPTLLVNQGDGTFLDATESAQLLPSANSNSAAWGDYDNDGLVDLYVCCERQPNRLYRNEGDGTFRNVTVLTGTQGTGKTLCKGAVWIDVDNDGDQDLFLNYFGGEAILLRNGGDGVFANASQELGIDGPEKGFSCWAWDYDNDGWLDLFANCYDQTLADVVKGIMGQPHERSSNRLYRNEHGQKFVDRTRDAGLDLVFAAMGSNIGDFDNDGWLDFYLGTGEPRFESLVPNRMFRNLKGGAFAEITTSSRTGHLQKGHSVSCGDWNRDGQMDVFVQMGGASNGDRAYNTMFQNPGHDHAWVSLKLAGVASARSAEGARIKVVCRGPQAQTVHRHVSTGSTFGANPLEQTIGLGAAAGIERLEVFWPKTGETQTFVDVAPGRCYVVREGATELYERVLPATQTPPASGGDAPAPSVKATPGIQASAAKKES